MVLIPYNHLLPILWKLYQYFTVYGVKLGQNNDQTAVRSLLRLVICVGVPPNPLCPNASRAGIQTFSDL